MNIHIETKKNPLSDRANALIHKRMEKIITEFNIIRANLKVQHEVNHFIVKACFIIPGRILNVHKKAEDIRSAIDLVLSCAHDALRKSKEKQLVKKRGASFHVVST